MINENKKPEIYLGIDPGKKGAIVGYVPSKHFKTPFIGIDWNDDIGIMVEWLNTIKMSFKIRGVLIEQVASRPGQSSRAVFSFGVGYGTWLGILAALNTPCDFITPQKWNSMFLHKRKSTKLSIGVAILTKFAHVREFMKKFLYGPRGGFYDGRADAIAISYCCYIIHSGCNEISKSKVLKKKRRQYK